MDKTPAKEPVLGLPMCPKCHSQDIEPVSDKLWRCKGCGAEFDAAMVEEAPAKSKGKEKK